MRRDLGPASRWRSGLPPHHQNQGVKNVILPPLRPYRHHHVPSIGAPSLMPTSTLPGAETLPTQVKGMGSRQLAERSHSLSALRPRIHVIRLAGRGRPRDDRPRTPPQRPERGGVGIRRRRIQRGAAMTTTMLSIWGSDPALRERRKAMLRHRRETMICRIRRRRRATSPRQRRGKELPSAVAAPSPRPSAKESETSSPSTMIMYEEEA